MTFVPHPRPEPFQRLQPGRLGHPGSGGIIGIGQVTAPGIDMNLNAIPRNVHHAAPQISFAVAVPVVRESLHGRQVVVVIPRPIWIIY